MVMIRKPDAVLNEMPPHVLDLIIGNGGVEERYRLRNVSKTFRTHIDQMSVDMNELAIWIHDAEVCYDFIASDTRHMVRYEDHLDGCTVRKEEPENDYPDVENPGKLVDGESFWKRAAEDLSNFLKNPKIKITTLKVTGNPTFYSDLYFEHLLAEHQKTLWRCRYFVVRYDGPDRDLAPLFSHVRHLQGIYFEKMDSSKPITEMVKLKPWRYAGFLTIDEMDQLMDLKDFMHFPVVQIGVEVLTVEQFKQILEHFSTSPNNKIRQCSIRFEELDLESLKPLLETDELKFESTRRIRFSREFKNLNSKKRFTVSVCNGGVNFSAVDR